MIDNMTIELKPIGIIHSPYKTGAETPHQGRGTAELSEIEIFEEYQTGIEDIEGFSHLIVLYYFHKSQSYTLRVRTPWDTAPHGVFTTRSPNRPNLLGLTVVTLIKREWNILIVKELDAIDNTPLLDIKPYIPQVDRRSSVNIGWLEGRLQLKSRQMF